MGGNCSKRAAWPCWSVLWHSWEPSVNFISTYLPCWMVLHQPAASPLSPPQLRHYQHYHRRSIATINPAASPPSPPIPADQAATHLVVLLLLCGVVVAESVRRRYAPPHRRPQWLVPDKAVGGLWVCHWGVGATLRGARLLQEGSAAGLKGEKDIRQGRWVKRGAKRGRPMVSKPAMTWRGKTTAMTWPEKTDDVAQTHCFSLVHGERSHPDMTKAALGLQTRQAQRPG